jgi:hypothetical protein
MIAVHTVSIIRYTKTHYVRKQSISTMLTQSSRKDEGGATLQEGDSKGRQNRFFSGKNCDCTRSTVFK